MPKSRRRDDDEDVEDRPRKRRRRDDDLPPGTPRAYVHTRCKEETEMPAEVIEEYLENPFELGEEPTTFCTGCETDVPWTECKWTETGQNLYEYIDDMRAEMVISGNDPRPFPPAFNWMLLIISVVVGAVAGGALGAGLKIMPVVFGAGGLVLGAIVGFVWMIIDRSRFTTEIEEWNRKLVKRYYKRHPEAQAKKKRRPRDDD